MGAVNMIAPFFILNPLKRLKMAKSIILEVDELIKKLEEHKAKGRTKVTLYGYIADESNDCNIVVSDKQAFGEQSFADWQLERNGF